MATILHVTDMQEDFGAKNGKLFVPEGDVVAQGINDFMDQVRDIDVTMVTFDSHFWFSYYSSPECLAFPEIHCEQDQSGWELVVDPSKMEGKSNVSYAPKETFNFWEDKATTNVEVKEHGVISSPLGYAFFEKAMQDKGATFVERGVSRDDFGQAVGHDFDASGAPFTGKVTVYPFDADKAGYKIKEGFYITEGENGKEVTVVADKKLVDVYNNIGQITRDAECLDVISSRDYEFEVNDDTKQDWDNLTVIMTGLASNFCVFDAMEGYLKRGASVVVIEDLMRGIPNGAEGQEFLLNATGVDRTATGDIKDVLKTKHFADYVAAGKVVVVKAADFLALHNGPERRLRNPNPFTPS